MQQSHLKTGKDKGYSLKEIRGSIQRKKEKGLSRFLSKLIFFLRRARKELIQAWQCYEERKSGLGDRLLDEIEFTLELIENKPELFPTRESLSRGDNESFFLPIDLSH